VEWSGVEWRGVAMLHVGKVGVMGTPHPTPYLCDN